MKCFIEPAFGSTSKHISGRKVDISVRTKVNHSWNHEICIVEFKTSTASEAVCKAQQNKSVRINTAILLDLEDLGLDITSFPIVADGHGLTLDIHAIRRYEDIIGAGQATDKDVWLPAEESQLRSFLESDSLHVLLEYAENMRRFAIDTSKVLTKPRVIPSTQSVPSTPPQKHEE
ncbi:hypothetical protein BGZ83_004021, partial [Gryganskiella cystojenkinii]